MTKTRVCASGNGFISEMNSWNSDAGSVDGILTNQGEPNILQLERELLLASGLGSQRNRTGISSILGGVPSLALLLNETNTSECTTTFPQTAHFNLSPLLPSDSPWGWGVLSSSVHELSSK